MLNEEWYQKVELLLTLGLIACTVIICAVAFQGCAHYSKWEYRAGNMALATYEPGKCIDRSIRLYREMESAGEKPTLLYGTYDGKGHAWIEWNGKILDTTQVDTRPELYKRRGILILAKVKE